MSNRLHIGIDAGGSKIEVRASFASASRSFTFPSVNARVSTPEKTVERVAKAIEAARADLSSVSDQGDVAMTVCAGIAGAASSELQALIQQGVADSTSLPNSSILIVSDAQIAFEAAFKRDPSSPRNQVLVISGTGSGCYSFKSSGELIRTGGWGPSIGDPGSGTELGKQFLRLVLEDVEIHQNTPFTQSLSHFLKGLHAEEGTPQEGDLGVSDVLDLIYNSKLPIAELAPRLLALATTNLRAKACVTKECERLAGQILRLSTMLKTKSPTVKLTGGLNANTLYSNTLIQTTKNMLPRASLSVSTTPPVEGALHLAKQIG